VLGITDPAEGAEWERLLVDLLAALGPAVLFVPALRRHLGGFGPWARLQRHIVRIERKVGGELARRRADGVERNDILSLILAARYEDGAPMSDRQVFETMMTLVTAGHETSAIAIAWALWEIHRHPQVRERLLAEVVGAADAPEAWARLPYLEAVCQETLRLHPVAPSFIRLLARPLTLGEWQLPAGVAVAASIIRLHQREDLYPEPGRFRPERFLERSFAPWELISFGGGHRRCIGAAFALFEMKVVVAALLRARPLRLVSEAPVGLVPRNTVLGPKRPLRFVA